MSQVSAPWPKLKRDLIAILRGVKPDEVLAIGEELVEAGIDVIEVPLNSPEPFQSIELLAKKLPSHVLIGAGTVLDPADIARLDAAGGRLMISPNVDAGSAGRGRQSGHGDDARRLHADRSARCTEGRRIRPEVLPCERSRT